MTMQSVSFDSNTFRTLNNPMPVAMNVSNVSWNRTASGGKERAVLLGPTVKRRGYRLYLQAGNSPDEESAWDTFIATLNSMSDTFGFLDHMNSSFTARFLADPVKTYDEVGDVFVDVEILEVTT